MKKTQTTSVQINERNTVIAYSNGGFYVQTTDGILVYTMSEMEEVYNLTDEDIVKVVRILNN